MNYPLTKHLPILLLATLLAVAPLGMPAFAEEGEGKKAAKSEGEGEGGGKPTKATSDVSGGRFAGDPIYVHIDPLLMPVITDKGVEQLVTIILEIEVKDFDVADDIHSKMPRVRDALMRALYGGLGQGNLRSGKIADVSKIKAKANGALTAVLGVNNVQDVLIQGIAQRML